MKPLSGQELQGARKAAAARFEAIGMKYFPEGYTLEYRKSLSGMHYGQSKRIIAPKPVTRKSLYIFLHECAHAHLHSHNGNVPRHVQEMEAEQWAHAKMRENSIPVPRAMTKRAKQYVARKIDQAVAHGAKQIDPAARRYANKEVPKRVAREPFEFKVICTVTGYKNRSHVDFRLDESEQIVTREDSEALRSLVMKMAKRVGVDIAKANYGSSIGTQFPERIGKA